MSRDIILVQRQRTAGAYITIQTFFRESDAINYLKSVAAMNPEFPYDGGKTYHVGYNKHNMTRYRIIPSEVAGSTPEVETKPLKRVAI